MANSNTLPLQQVTLDTLAVEYKQVEPNNPAGEDTLAKGDKLAKVENQGHKQANSKKGKDNTPRVVEHKQLVEEELAKAEYNPQVAQI